MKRKWEQEKAGWLTAQEMQGRKCIAVQVSLRGNCCGLPLFVFRGPCAVVDPLCCCGSPPCALVDAPPVLLWTPPPPHITPPPLVLKRYPEPEACEPSHPCGSR